MAWASRRSPIHQRKGNKMNDKCLRELAYWLNNNTDWTVDMPNILTGVEQDKLEKFLKAEQDGE